MRAIGLSAVLTALCLGPTVAQSLDGQIITEPRCWFGSMTFSPNATIRAANEVMICDNGGSWASTDKDAAGCLRDGEFFAAGAIEGVTNNKNIWIECGEDGTWQQKK